MLSTFACIVRRDLELALRRRADVFTTLFFFVIVISLFPLGVGPEPALLRAMAMLRHAGRSSFRPGAWPL